MIIGGENHGKKIAPSTMRQWVIRYNKRVDLIISNREKYSISAMCKLLEVLRSLVYYSC